MSSVFLSHSHADKAFVRKLAADLRLRGHSVWVDEAEIEIGDSLIEKIRQGLDEVDYVAAVLSCHSVTSTWVTRELDIASNREMNEGRVLVLPLLIESVELPGFLQGKFYGDFRDPGGYDAQLELLLRKLGAAEPTPPVPPAELAILQEQLDAARQQAAQYQSDLQVHQRAALVGKSDSLKSAILAANEKFPLHAPINSTYAFEVMGLPVTLDYALWSIGKASRRGTAPLEAGLTAEDKWGEIEAMLAAYSDMLAAAGEGAPEGPASAASAQQAHPADAASAIPTPAPERCSCATSGGDRSGRHVIRPHTPEWFYALQELAPDQAAMTAHVLELAGSSDVCSVCGDTPAADYTVDGVQFHDGSPGTLRLCDDCRRIRTSAGDGLTPCGGAV